MTVTVSFTNPLPLPLTSCYLELEGNLEVAEDDKNPMESFFFSHGMRYRSEFLAVLLFFFFFLPLTGLMTGYIVDWLHWLGG